MKNWQDKIGLLILVLAGSMIIYWILFFVALEFNSQQRNNHIAQLKQKITKTEEDSVFLNKCITFSNNTDEQKFIFNLTDCLNKEWGNKNSLNGGIGILYLKLINQGIKENPQDQILAQTKNITLKLAKAGIEEQAKDIHRTIELENFCYGWKYLGCYIRKNIPEFKDGDGIVRGYKDFWLEQIKQEEKQPSLGGKK